jgi:hypothetical protein
LDFIGHPADYVPSTSRPNGVFTVNSDGLTSSGNTADGFKSKCVGCQTNTAHIFQSDGSHHNELLDSISATSTIKQLVLGLDKHKQLLGAEL